ncbi:MAG: hypothetical protein IPP63_07465 [Chloracidobacterium sp.]|nr:hypothetical protein [Chloracidobacterium sp.]
MRIISNRSSRRCDDVTEFQIKIESEFEKHKSHIDEAFNGFSARFDSEHTFDEGFRESVVEHMRLARDEGAKITATAITNAEEMERLATPEFNLADIKEAVIDISSKDSQSAILKALIQHAASFTPRGAFFIIKGVRLSVGKYLAKKPVMVRMRFATFTSRLRQIRSWAIRYGVNRCPKVGSEPIPKTIPFWNRLSLASPIGCTRSRWSLAAAASQFCTLITATKALP